MSTGLVLLLSLILIGAVQGLIMVCFLLSTVSSVKANIYLSFLILFITMANLNAYFLPQELSSFWQQIGNVFPLLIFMPIGPLLWLYIKTSINGWEENSKKWLHFLPVLLDLFPYFLAAGFYLGFFKQQDQLFNFIANYDVYIDIPRWFSLSYYLWRSYQVLDRAQRKSGAAQPLLKHCRQFLYSFAYFQLIWLIFLIPYSLPQLREQLLNTLGWFPIYIPLSVLVYTISLISYQMLRLTKQQIKTKPTQQQLAPHAVSEAIQMLTKAMEVDQLYLKPNLDLALVMVHTGLPQKTISTVLNHHYHQSFNEFINHYRIEAVKQWFDEGKTRHYTINGIALACGFNSQATFQRTFKQKIGLSPSQYLQKIK